jgi:hypothetical protein
MGERYRLGEGPAGHRGWHGDRVACRVALIRALAESIGLTAGLSRALVSGRLMVDDRAGCWRASAARSLTALRRSAILR